MLIHDLGTMNYRDAWAMQERAHAEVVAGGVERVFFVEHPPVITLGRRPGIDQHLLASTEQLMALGVEVVQSDRGGDITFHGPGQLVAYPIIRLVDHGLSVSGYVHSLEDAVIDVLNHFDIQTTKDPAAVGVWADDGGTPAKACAMGVRIRRGVTLHGLALNVTTPLNYFNLIIPCGLANRPVTSMQKMLGDRTPGMDKVKAMLARSLEARLMRQPVQSSAR